MVSFEKREIRKFYASGLYQILNLISYNFIELMKVIALGIALVFGVQGLVRHDKSEVGGHCTTDGDCWSGICCTNHGVN